MKFIYLFSQTSCIVRDKPGRIDSWQWMMQKLWNPRTLGKPKNRKTAPSETLAGKPRYIHIRSRPRLALLSITTTNIPHPLPLSINTIPPRTTSTMAGHKHECNHPPPSPSTSRRPANARSSQRWPGTRRWSNTIVRPAYYPSYSILSLSVSPHTRAMPLPYSTPSSKRLRRKLQGAEVS